MDQKLKMKDITQLTGVSKSTVLYHLSLGLLPEPIKTAKNTASYPASYLKIIPAIRFLQEHMHWPLAVIKQLIDSIGFENFSVERALHDYETFMKPHQSGDREAVYSKKDLGAASNLVLDEVSELETRGLLLSLVGESYYYEDLLAANAYKKLKDSGIGFSEVEGLSGSIKELARQAHELFHEKTDALGWESEQEISLAMREELQTVFEYLISKYVQGIYRREKS
ncbi:MAG: MerR family transcriptional regulator [Peptococcaceae bacterium]|nr:MerR family transcriptional regulator [Peptococcaceae bacterium]